MLIRKGNPFVIKLSLTIVSLYRDIIYDSKIDTSSITKPYSGSKYIINQIVAFIPHFVDIFVPKSLGGREALKGKFRYFPISTSSPQSNIPD